MTIKVKDINGFNLHPIGIGTYLVGGGKYDDSQATQYIDVEKGEKESLAIRHSLSLGQNFIDTAEFYSAGYSEVVIGKAIKDVKREKLFVGSKLWKSHLRRSSIVYAVEEMLKRLQTNYLDIVYPHFPWEEYEPMKNYMAGLNDVVDKGLVKSIGASNCNLKQLKKMSSFSKHPIVACQIKYNLLNREKLPDELRNYCIKNAILIIAYGPLGTGDLAGGGESKVLLDVAKKYKKTPAQIALNWLISQSKVIAIPKAVNKEHIDENLGAMEFEMEENDINILNSL